MVLLEVPLLVALHFELQVFERLFLLLSSPHVLQVQLLIQNRAGREGEDFLEVVVYQLLDQYDDLHVQLLLVVRLDFLLSARLFLQHELEVLEVVELLELLLEQHHYLHQFLLKDLEEFGVVVELGLLVALVQKLHQVVFVVDFLLQLGLDLHHGLDLLSSFQHQLLYFLLVLLHDQVQVLVDDNVAEVLGLYFIDLLYQQRGAFKHDSSLNLQIRPEFPHLFLQKATRMFSLLRTRLQRLCFQSLSHSLHLLLNLLFELLLLLLGLHFEEEPEELHVLPELQKDVFIFVFQLVERVSFLLDQLLQVFLLLEQSVQFALLRQGLLLLSLEFVFVLVVVLDQLLLEPF